MPEAEALSPMEAGSKIGEHAEHAHEAESTDRRDKRLSITEAVVLSLVTLVAAWAGYSAAKWGTESSLKLAKASATRVKANRAFQQALTYQTADAVTFNAWYAAYIARDKAAMRVAHKYFLPNYRVAFDAWLATKPFTNRNAPAGPEAMPQFHPPGAAQARLLDAQADAYYARGQAAAETGDHYIRATVILASVLFLIGISTQFPIRRGRFALISVGLLLLLIAGEQILTLPGPP
ncbi:MAG TPA: hypothetical protein VMT10_10590 [Solirubrobacteraceae bacterium]|nr:hypothetical protein [Solirubrobacteraceae bacterium]